MPGSQLVNKLQDLNYRVQTVNDSALLQPGALRENPLLVLADLAGGDKVMTAIAGLKADAATSHIPVIAVCRRGRRRRRWQPRKKPGRISPSAISRLPITCRNC